MKELKLSSFFILNSEFGLEAKMLKKKYDNGRHLNHIHNVYKRCQVYIF